MRTVRWVVTGLAVGIVGGFVGGLLTGTRTETRAGDTWLPDGPAVPLRELQGTGSAPHPDPLRYARFT